MSSRSNAIVRRDPVVGVDLDDVEHLGVERIAALIAARERTRLRARRSPRVATTVDVMFLAPTSAIARMFAIAASRPCRIACVHDPPTVLGDYVVGQLSAIASQSRAAK